MTVTGTAEARQVDAQLGGRIAPAGVVIAWGLSLALMGLILFAPLDRVTVGALVLALTVTLLLTGVPIAFAILIAAVIGLWSVGSAAVVNQAVSDTVFSATTSWSLSVIPGFVLMGALLGKSGMTGRLFTAARLWTGWLPGGLAVGTNFAGAGLASISGSTIGVTYALGRVALPSMLESGYDKRLATGTVSIVGTLGQLIPPSILLVVYAGVAQTPVGPQLLAAIIPALILAVSYAVLIVVRCTVDRSLAPRVEGDERSPGVLIRSLGNVVPVLMVFLGVVGGMYLGFFTATEAAAFGVLAAVIVAWLFNSDFRKSPRVFLRSIREGLIEAVAATATIFLLLTAVHVLTRLLSLSQLTNEITSVILALDMGRVTFLLVLVVMYLIMGMFLEPMAMILLTVPILMEPLQYYGVDLLWFGVFILIVGEIAQVTPPVGIMTYIVHRLAQEPEVNGGVAISLGDVFRGAVPFVLVTLVVLLLLIFVPELTQVLMPIS